VYRLDLAEPAQRQVAVQLLRLAAEHGVESWRGPTIDGRPVNIKGVRCYKMLLCVQLVGRGGVDWIGCIKGSLLPDNPTLCEVLIALPSKTSSPRPYQMTPQHLAAKGVLQLEFASDKRPSLECEPLTDEVGWVESCWVVLAEVGFGLHCQLPATTSSCQHPLRTHPPKQST